MMQPTVWKEEEQHLEETLREIDRNIERYSKEAAMLREENQERYDTYRSPIRTCTTISWWTQLGRPGTILAAAESICGG